MEASFGQLDNGDSNEFGPTDLQTDVRNGLGLGFFRLHWNTDAFAPPLEATSTRKEDNEWSQLIGTLAELTRRLSMLLARPMLNKIKLPVLYETDLCYQEEPNGKRRFLQPLDETGRPGWLKSAQLASKHLVRKIMFYPGLVDALTPVSMAGCSKRMCDCPIGSPANCCQNPLVFFNKPTRKDLRAKRVETKELRESDTIPSFRSQKVHDNEAFEDVGQLLKREKKCKKTDSFQYNGLPTVAGCDSENAANTSSAYGTIDNKTPDWYQTQKKKHVCSPGLSTLNDPAYDECWNASQNVEIIRALLTFISCEQTVPVLMVRGYQNNMELRLASLKNWAGRITCTVPLFHLAELGYWCPPGSLVLVCGFCKVQVPPELTQRCSANANLAAVAFYSLHGLSCQVLGPALIRACTKAGLHVPEVHRETSWLLQRMDDQLADIDAGPSEYQLEAFLRILHDDKLDELLRLRQLDFDWLFSFVTTTQSTQADTARRTTPDPMEQIVMQNVQHDFNFLPNADHEEQSFNLPSVVDHVGDLREL